MATFGEVLRRLREEKGLNVTALAREVGITKGYISMIENHRVSRPPAAHVVAAMEKALGVRDGSLRDAADWQITPKDIRKELERKTEAARAARELAEKIRKASGKRKEGGRDLDELLRSGDLPRLVKAVLGSTEEPDNVKPAERLRGQIPLINRVSAGYPRDFTDLGYPARIADEYISCPEVADPDSFAARVVGESMMPDYREGDVVVFSPRAPVADGADCFARLEPDHESTFKRVYFETGPAGKAMIRLQPLNPRFPARTLPREQVAGLYRAIWKYQRL